MNEKERLEALLKDVSENPNDFSYDYEKDKKEKDDALFSRLLMESKKETDFYKKSYHRLSCVKDILALLFAFMFNCLLSGVPRNLSDYFYCILFSLIISVPVIAFSELPVSFDAIPEKWAQGLPRILLILIVFLVLSALSFLFFSSRF